MTPPLDKPGLAEPEPELNSPEDLKRATEKLHALGIEGKVAFHARTPEQLRAFLRSRPKCATST